mmetsp:Transcript_38963/g.111911  ORF Transcript_38963/g.111911 Transcript_38963/m.111911 type:complete len:225 (-) Transcript_38963:1194-1868(-)
MPGGGGEVRKSADTAVRADVAEVQLRPPCIGGPLCSNVFVRHRHLRRFGRLVRRCNGLRRGNGALVADLRRGLRARLPIVGGRAATQRRPWRHGGVGLRIAHRHVAQYLRFLDARRRQVGADKEHLVPEAEAAHDLTLEERGHAAVVALADESADLHEVRPAELARKRMPHIQHGPRGCHALQRHRSAPAALRDAQLVVPYGRPRVARRRRIRRNGYRRCKGCR